MSGFRKTESLTRPSTSFKDAEIGSKRVFKFLTPVYVGKDIDRDGKEKRDKPADLAHVLEYPGAEEFTLVVPEIIKSTLVELGEKEYVGRWFEITFMGQPEGKRYKQYKVDRGDIKDDDKGWVKGANLRVVPTMLGAA